MQIDWERALDEILAEKIMCQRCGTLQTEVVVGYTRSSAAAEFAPRCRECERKDECNERKLVVVCGDCARELRIRGKKVDEEGMMTILMSECRRELEECLDYLIDYWQEDLDIDLDVEISFEEADPEAFAEEGRWRQRLEDEYLTLHKWFRDHARRIPDPGWRSEYVEEVLGLGYETLLGN